MKNRIYDWDQDHPHIKWLVSAVVFLIAMVIGTVSVRGQFGVEQPMFQPLLSQSTIPLNGIGLWLKPESLSGADGTSITDWMDSSGYRNDGTNSVNGPYITNNAINGYPAAAFAAAGNPVLFFRTNSGRSLFRNRTEVTLFLVWLRRVNNTEVMSFDTANSTGPRFRLLTANNDSPYWQGKAPDTATLYDNFSTSVKANGWVLTTALANYTTGTMIVYTNGRPTWTNTGWATPGPTTDSDTPAGDACQLGYKVGPIGIQVAEMLIYTNGLNSNDIWSVNAYLTNKFALP